MEHWIASAEVIDVTKHAGDRVIFGATVTLEDSDSGDEVRYRIVGELEADLKQGKISVTSPIARALIGRVEGDAVTVADAGRGPRVRDPAHRVHRGRGRGVGLIG